VVSQWVRNPIKGSRLSIILFTLFLGGPVTPYWDR